MIHLAGELFKARTGIDIVHVPYRGGGPAMNDLVAGNIAMMFDSLPSALPHVEGGRVRAFGLCGTKRHPLVPDLPTLTEQGVPNYNAASTGGLFAPRGTPQQVIAVLNAAVRELAAQPAFREQLGRSGGDAEASTPEGLGEMMAQESALWAEVVRDAGITTN
jgi:tripartite-type tricarboxylate transporter receptor subunit TctC